MSARTAAKLLHEHNKDFRPNCLQLVYGLNITEDGNVPLSFHLFDGNTTDDTTHIPNWDNIRQQSVSGLHNIYLEELRLIENDFAMVLAMQKKLRLMQGLLLLLSVLRQDF